MTREEIQFAARGTLHDFLLEALFAMALADHPQPPEMFKELRAQLMHLIQFKTRVSPNIPDGDYAVLLHEELVRQSEHFFDNVEARMKNILDIRSRA
jgi:hypothetical protein